MSKCAFCKKEQPNRSEAQNRSLWLFCTQLATALNEAGLEMKMVLRPEYNVWWNKDLVHDLLWIPVQKVLFKTSSTTELTKLEQIDRIHELIMRELGEKHGVEYIPWPTQEKIDGKIIGKNFTI